MTQTTSEPMVKTLTRLNYFSRKEMAELPNLLMPGEEVMAVITGFYTAGTAILCVTSKRLLLVDKKWIRLSYEDVRFESIREINYSHQALMASVKFYFAGREMQFKSWYKNELRMAAQLIQHKMFEVREKLHRTTDESSLTDIVESSELPEPAPQYKQNPDLDEYLRERIARWRRASRFVDTLTVSSKAGRQILNIAVPKR